MLIGRSLTYIELFSPIAGLISAGYAINNYFYNQMTKLIAQPNKSLCNKFLLVWLLF
jgi:hypothetical protein